MPSPELEWQQLNVLVTGGTGTFGKQLTEMLLSSQGVGSVLIYSRDELKQDQMRRQFVAGQRLRFLIGDVRDRDQLRRAMRGINLVVHAASLKQVPTAEFNPLEAVKTNIMGTANVIAAAIDCGVERFIALSTDKAVAPLNMYGATKLCAEKLVLAANETSNSVTRYSVARYGNVLGSRGSVLQVFDEYRPSGTIPITDSRMSRFWTTAERSARLLTECVMRMQGGEIFVPKLPSMRIIDLASAVAPECRHQFIGLRPGEKLHETLLTEDEARYSRMHDNYFVIRPPLDESPQALEYSPVGTGLPDGFRYSSDTNDWWLTAEELRNMVCRDESTDDFLRSAVH